MSQSKVSKKIVIMSNAEIVYMDIIAYFLLIEKFFSENFDSALWICD